MIKKTTLIIACLLTSIFVKAQISSSKNSSSLLTEEKITQHLENARKNGIHADEIGMQKKILHQKLKQQNEAIANGTFGQKIILTPAHVNTSACTNPGFENGTNSDWNFYHGDINLVNLPCDTCPVSAGAISMVVNSASSAGGQCTNGFDNYGHFPVVAPGSAGGSYSLLLNDASSAGKIQKAQYKFLNSAASTNFFTYQYAVVLQNGGHPLNEQAYFSVEMLDVTTNLIIPCSSYQQSVPTTGSIAGWSQSSQNTYFKPWTSVGVDLSAYVGDTIEVNFVVSDCNQGGHFGYAYIDAACGLATNQITQANILCTGGSTILQGPSGFNNYNWAGPVTGTSQNLVTGLAGTYTLSSTSGTGCAAPVLYYTLTQSSAIAPTVSINASNDTICANATTTLTASGASTYAWSDNETTNSISISPSNNVTFTVTGTDNVTGCVNYATQLISIKQPLVNVTMQTSANYTCAGTPLTFTASGANTYTWSTGANTNTITVFPTVNTNYSATGTDTTTGCTNTGLLFIYVANNDTLINNNDSICVGSGASLSAGGIGTYTWSTGAISASITVAPIVTTTYTLYGSGGCSGTSTHTTSVYVKPTPNVTLSATALCAPTVTLTAGGANTYSWSTYEITPTITVSTAYSNTYALTGTASNMCSDTVSIRINATAGNIIPFICMATTDSTTSYAYNYLVWDKTAYTNVDSFFVYRYDVLSSNYLKIGAVSVTALSQFKDTAFSVGGPNGGNPQYASWQYKLAILDSCGNISQYSPYHQTMFVQQNGGNFTWNAYTVEAGQTNSVIGYSLLRDDNNTGNWQVLVNTNTLAATDPNYSSYPNGNWRVEALGFNCTATLRLAANNNSIQNSYLKSSSNTLKPLAITGINKIAETDLDLMLYPNPTNNILNVVCKVKNTKFYITDMLGKRVMQVNAANELTTIDVSQLSNGIYFLNTITANGLINKKFVVQQ